MKPDQETVSGWIAERAQQLLDGAPTVHPTPDFEPRQSAAEWEAELERAKRETFEAYRRAAERATGMPWEELEGRCDLEAGLPPAPPQPQVSRETLTRTRHVPDVHVAAVFDREPEECFALMHVRSFVSNRETFLVLSGGVGSMKTGSACWALTKRAGLFVTAGRLSRMGYSPDFDELLECSFLVLDDLGTEYADQKGHSEEVISELVDARYGGQRKTVITTNLDAVAFKARYGERVARRIRESGKFIGVAKGTP